VLAAGGIADGRGLVAALALGAIGIWVGTRFIATHEAYGHDNYKKKIVAIDEEGTVVHRGATGKPCRAIRNDFTREWEKRAGEILPFPLQAQRVGFPAAIRAREDGDIDGGHAACGQSAGLIQDIVSARDVVERMVAEAEAALAQLEARSRAIASRLPRPSPMR
jgi:enoyl-[acyl-carrier protein] reductase II